MATEVKDILIAQVVEKLSEFCKRVDDNIARQQQQREARKKKIEQESQMAQELKLNKEMTASLAKVSGQSSELARVCAALESRLTIADSDQTRLQHAKEMYQVAKELTDIRFDFTSPPHIVKGYVKSESRKVLESFEIHTAATCAGAGLVAELWDRIAATHLDKE